MENECSGNEMQSYMSLIMSVENNIGQESIANQILLVSLLFTHESQTERN